MIYLPARLDESDLLGSEVVRAGGNKDMHLPFERNQVLDSSVLLSLYNFVF